MLIIQWPTLVQAESILHRDNTMHQNPQPLPMVCATLHRYRIRQTNLLTTQEHFEIEIEQAVTVRFDDLPEFFRARGVTRVTVDFPTSGPYAGQMVVRRAA